MRVFSSLILVTGFCSAHLTLAQNLVTNGSFDVDLGGWTQDPISDGSAVWFPTDCCGNANSGSARLTAVVTSFNALDSNCMPVTAGSSYDVVVMANTLPLPPGFLSTAEVSVLWYADVGCPFVTTNMSTINVGTSAGWRQVGTTLIAPDNVVGAKVQLIARGQGLSTAIDAYFDDVRFGPAGTVPVELQSFVVE